MTEFNTPVDIANRALQHCGATRINPMLGFSENSKNASETAFAYGKVRRAELRRNVWRFATRRTVLRAIDPNTMLLTPSMWSATTTYFVGSIVSDETSNLWISQFPDNLNFDPLNSVTWEPYFGPLTVTLFDPAMVYFAGEVVYTATGDGTSRVYLSLQSGNSDVPATATAWISTGTFFKNQVVTYLGVAYMSLTNLNKGNIPSASPALWSVATSYASGAQVGGSDGVIYTSAHSANIGNDPILDTGTNWTSTGTLNQWTTAFVGGAGSDKWLQIGGAEFPNGVGLTPMNIIYPLGAGPSTQPQSSNVYRLPAGYLRTAPQNPGSRSTSWLGGPTGISYHDWAFESDFLVTADTGSIAFRFVADLTDVRAMDDMFCEGLAARVALEVCEPITQSGGKLNMIAKIYQEWIDAARTVNAIEMGPDDPPDDDYVSVRL